MKVTNISKRIPDRTPDETFGDILDGPAFERFADDVLDDTFDIWEWINHGRYTD